MALATFPDGTVPEPVEVSRIATFLFGAGQETTARLLASAVMILAEHPGIQRRLRADRSLVANFVEEALRFESPVKADFRLARRSTTPAHRGRALPPFPTSGVSTGGPTTPPTT